MSEEQPSDNALAELEAMRAIYEAIKPLDEASRKRVLAWVSSKAIAGAAISTGGASNPAIPGVAQKSPIESSDEQVPDLPTFFAQTNPQTLADKALVAAYWFQTFQHQEDLDSQQINTELKHLGHGLGNVTRTMDALVGSRPQLVIQTRKEGTAKQARKKYRVTQEGVKRVKLLIANQQSGGLIE